VPIACTGEFVPHRPPTLGLIHYLHPSPQTEKDPLRLSRSPHGLPVLREGRNSCSQLRTKSTAHFLHCPITGTVGNRRTRQDGGEGNRTPYLFPPLSRLRLARRNHPGHFFLKTTKNLNSSLSSTAFHRNLLSVQALYPDPANPGQNEYLEIIDRS